MTSLRQICRAGAGRTGRSSCPRSCNVGLHKTLGNGPTVTSNEVVKVAPVEEPLVHTQHEFDGNGAAVRVAFQSMPFAAKEAKATKRVRCDRADRLVRPTSEGSGAFAASPNPLEIADPGRLS